MYTGFIFTGVYFGYAMGVTPVIGFHYGAGNKGELSNVFKKSMMLTAGAATVMTCLAVISAPLMAQIFAGYDPVLCGITVNAIRIYSVCYLMLGFNVFGSALFTALNNGLVSAVISVFRVFVFEIIAVMLLPEILGLNGVWAAAPAAETAAVCVTGFCIWHFRNRYGYMGKAAAA